MTCQQLDDAIVDYARGLAVGAGTSAAIESHVETCRACAARLARERELTRGLRAIAVDRAAEQGSPALESALMAAFAAAHAPSGARRWSLPAAWLARAAAVALVAGATAVALTLYRGRPSEPVAQPQSEAVAPAPQTPPGPPGLPPRPDGVPDETTAPARAAGAPDRTARRPTPRGAQPPVLSLEDFIALPAAAGLPAIESGRVVRVDLPIAALPSLGFDVVPAAAPAAGVRADVLVGQDGQPRAIRFVTDDDRNRR